LTITQVDLNTSSGSSVPDNQGILAPSLLLTPVMLLMIIMLFHGACHSSMINMMFIGHCVNHSLATAFV
jgi:hypothetical protein